MLQGSNMRPLLFLLIIIYQFIIDSVSEKKEDIKIIFGSIFKTIFINKKSLSLEIAIFFYTFVIVKKNKDFLLFFIICIQK